MEEYRKTLLISASELKNNTLISANVDDAYLSSTIITCQEVYLEDIIGTALYHKLQELVYNTIKKATDNINKSSNSVYKEILEEGIKPFLKARCTVDILYNISYKIRNIGVTTNSDTNTNTVSMEEIRYLEKQYNVYVASFSEKLSKMLKYHKEDLPELTDETPSYFNEPNIDKDYASDAGLWLGGNKNKRCCK